MSEAWGTRRVTVDRKQQIWAIAEEELTEFELRVWWLSVLGTSQRMTADMVNRSRTQCVDATDNAWKKLAKRGVKCNASGLPYLEETA
jgi:hypothetical protein